jgi:membrane-associated phospholipid phosphatase
VLAFSAPLAVELLEVTLGDPEGPVWRGDTFGEESITDWFAADTARARNRADHVSDWLQTSLLVFPVLIDGVVTAWLVRDSPDVAWQLTAVSLQAYASMGLVLLGSIRLIARERPLRDDCQNDPDYSPLCNTEEEFRGFPSGHMATAVMGAGLTCSHHLYLDLWGSVADETLCGVMLAGALVDGTLRLISGRHYPSDLLAGAAVGATFGWLVPWLLHYGHADPKAPPPVVLAPDIAPERVGLTARAAF